MNWLDITLIVILVLGLLWGLKTGLISAIFTAVGILVGWIVAGQLADDIGGIFESSPNSDTVVTIVSYAVIIVASVVIIGFIGKMLKPIIVIGTLGAAGMADKLGGLAMGLIIGLAIAGVFITGMARFAYNFTIPTPDIEVPGVSVTAAEGVAKLDRKQAIEDALTASTIVPIFMSIRGALPGNALGFIPADFAAALDILQAKLDAMDAQ